MMHCPLQSLILGSAKPGPPGLQAPVPNVGIQQDLPWGKLFLEGSVRTELPITESRRIRQNLPQFPTPSIKLPCKEIWFKKVFFLSRSRTSMKLGRSIEHLHTKNIAVQRKRKLTNITNSAFPNLFRNRS